MKERADKVLLDQKLVPSRSQAKSLIESGKVSVNGKIITKSGELIDRLDQINISSEIFVGRGALKLESALKEFNISPEGKVYVDFGASTGGFTEILLNRGALRVYAVDVGRDQLAEKLRSDFRVINMESTNIKDISSLPELADGAVMDLSFISITKVLSTVRKLLKINAPLIVLVKPQFEAGRDRLPRDGVVKDKYLQKQILDEIIQFAKNEGWNYHDSIDSPIEGKSGNREFFCLFTRS